MTGKPFIIPVFIPHQGCPHQCVFCNQKTITGSTATFPDAESLRKIVFDFLDFARAHRTNVQIAFYGGNFLGLKAERLCFLLNKATDLIHQGAADSIRFSTRPDTITDERLKMIAAYPIKIIELGAQSMDDSVLKKIKRGHSSRDTEKALKLLREHGYVAGLQLMVGLPDEDEASLLSTGRYIVNLHPDFVRIYPTVVLKESLLARWYLEGRYFPLSIKEAVERVKILYRLFQENDIPVIRMGLQASEDLDAGDRIVAGPYHPSFGELVYSALFFDKAKKMLENSKPLPDTITLKVNPRSLSKMRGHKNRNMIKLKAEFRAIAIDLVCDSSLSEDTVEMV
ncbi:MAG: radical SAM protein [Deltaproteobacteria bacterium]|nr:radical SAM protein [Deltaproteobacteria bacterium]MBW2152036.1 radical SAM protein [Deltaproteobacteria bacterium]